MNLRLINSRFTDMLHQGQRVYLNGKDLWMPPCSYGKDREGQWHVRGPYGHAGILQPASDWNVTEHDDGTITVSPSLDMPGTWHGFLERGVFKDAE